MHNSLAFAFATDGYAAPLPSSGRVSAGIVEQMTHLFASDDKPRRIVRGTRRRPSEQSGEPRERADAPRRDDCEGGSRPPAQGR